MLTTDFARDDVHLLLLPPWSKIMSSNSVTSWGKSWSTCWTGIIMDMSKKFHIFNFEGKNLNLK